MKCFKKEILKISQVFVVTQVHFNTFESLYSLDPSSLSPSLPPSFSSLWLENWTQGFKLAEWGLYHLSHTSSPLLSISKLITQILVSKKGRGRNSCNHWSNICSSPNAVLGTDEPGIHSWQQWCRKKGKNVPDYIEAVILSPADCCRNTNERMKAMSSQRSLTLIWQILSWLLHSWSFLLLLLNLWFLETAFHEPLKA